MLCTFLFCYHPCLVWESYEEMGSFLSFCLLENLYKMRTICFSKVWWNLPVKVSPPHWSLRLLFYLLVIALLKFFIFLCQFWHSIFFWEGIHFDYVFISTDIQWSVVSFDVLNFCGVSGVTSYRNWRPWKGLWICHKHDGMCNGKLEVATRLQDRMDMKL